MAGRARRWPWRWNLLQCRRQEVVEAGLEEEEAAVADVEEVAVLVDEPELGGEAGQLRCRRVKAVQIGAWSACS